MTELLLLAAVVGADDVVVAIVVDGGVVDNGGSPRCPFFDRGSFFEFEFRSSFQNPAPGIMLFLAPFPVVILRC